MMHYKMSLNKNFTVSNTNILLTELTVKVVYQLSLVKIYYLRKTISIVSKC
jgi:hypothetical protein